MIPEHELKADDVHQMLFKTMQTYLSLKTEGWRCTTEQTLNSLIKVVADGSSLEAVCADTSELVGQQHPACGSNSTQRINGDQRFGIVVAKTLSIFYRDVGKAPYTRSERR